MINVAIIDDRLDEVQELQRWLEKHQMVSFIGTFTSPNSILPKIKDVELLFCDIEMPEINGFEFLRILKDKPEVVFISSHGEYALDSFEFSPIHFIQKPLELAKVLEAIERMRLTKEFKDFCKRDFIFVKNGHQDFVKVNFSEILFISALDDYVQIHLSNARITIYTRLKEIKTRLSSSFVQSHRSFIVNLEHVKMINSKDIELKNGMEVPISATYKESLKEVLGK